MFRGAPSVEQVEFTTDWLQERLRPFSALRERCNQPLERLACVLA